ncbi:MAG: hypothetical protein IGR76_00130 [Synechococcales cyanobacterium T60_A2020_003]|nr:hypothetical protein [Synechococcales cyanobacterium T60_A2020_003]
MTQQYMESSPTSSLLHPPCFAIATTPLADAFSCLDGRCCMKEGLRAGEAW